jgi:hypothetical protein
MMDTTTFQQVIGYRSYKIRVPVGRVSSVMDRIDDLMEAKNYDKALKALKPFIITDVEGSVTKAKRVAKRASNRTEKGIAVQAVIEKYRAMGRATVLQKLQEECNITYANAYYYCKKVDVE